MRVDRHPENSLIHGLPLVELHSHLGGTITADSLIKLARNGREGLLPTLVPSFLSELLVAQSKKQFFEILQLTKPFRQSPEDWSLISKDEFNRAKLLNVQYAEYRFGSGQLIERGEKYLYSILSSIKAEQDASFTENGSIFQLVWGINRNDYNNSDKLVSAIIELWQDGWIVGVDLNGDEENYPTSRFISLFQRFAKLGIPITIHAGEWDGPQSIWDAIRAGAVRIGHATNAIYDKHLVNYIRNEKIVLEICLSSEICTGVVENIQVHPIKEYLDAGLNVTINSDDPSIFGTNILNEYTLALIYCNIDVNYIKRIIMNGIEGAFLPYKSKQNLVDKFRNLLSTIDLKERF